LVERNVWRESDKTQRLTTKQEVFGQKRNAGGCGKNLGRRGAMVSTAETIAAQLMKEVGTKAVKHCIYSPGLIAQTQRNNFAKNRDTK
jgi:hypothetical protein